MSKKKAFLILAITSFLIMISSISIVIYFLQQKMAIEEGQKLSQSLLQQVRRDISVGDYRRVYETLLNQQVGNLKITDFDIIIQNRRTLNTESFQYKCNEQSPSKLTFCIDDNDGKVYYFELSRPGLMSVFQSTEFKLIFLLTLALNIVFNLLLIKLFSSQLNYFINSFNKIIQRKDLNRDEIEDFGEFKEGMIKLKSELKRSDNELQKKTKLEAQVAISRQVAHDIRSPLAALKMALEEVENIPSDYRNMFRVSVQRINDIANNLLNDDTKKSTSPNSQLEIELLAPIIDSLVSEKRMNYRKKSKINIESNLTKSYGLFANVNSIELKRVLSNLINNSVEALDSSGEVVVSISETINGEILLSVNDNGKGMPEDVLRKLGEKGFSHGKNGLDSGLGLGFHHALETINSFGGRLEVESTLNLGTTVKISLTKAAIPSWFVETLYLEPMERIFVLDDDESMLRAWSERLPFKVEVFTNGEEFSESITSLNSKKLLALVDYELLGQETSGLELIKLLQIEKQSILVTSRFEEKELREKCNQLGVRLIPKMMAALMPIKLATAKIEPLAPYDYVYIDDDEIMRISWERKAKKKNFNLLVLSSTKELEFHLDKISKEFTQFYIDSHLGEGEMPGEDFAKILHEQGYKHLSIASGYEATYFAHLDWLKYSGKDCPF